VTVRVRSRYASQAPRLRSAKKVPPMAGPGWTQWAFAATDFRQPNNSPGDLHRHRCSTATCQRSRSIELGGGYRASDLKCSSRDRNAHAQGVVRSPWTMRATTETSADSGQRRSDARHPEVAGAWVRAQTRNRRCTSRPTTPTRVFHRRHQPGGSRQTRSERQSRSFGRPPESSTDDRASRHYHEKSSPPAGALGIHVCAVGSGHTARPTGRRPNWDGKFHVDPSCV